MKTICSLICAFALAAAAVSCDKEHIDLPTAPPHPAPPTPTNVRLSPGAEMVTVSWSYPPASLALLKEFRVYQYFEAYNVVELVGTTQDTSLVDSFLIGNLFYCYVVSAVDSTGFEGYRTHSVCAFVPSH